MKCSMLHTLYIYSCSNEPPHHGRLAREVRQYRNTAHLSRVSRIRTLWKLLEGILSAEFIYVKCQRQQHFPFSSGNIMHMVRHLSQRQCTEINVRYAVFL